MVFRNWITNYKLLESNRLWIDCEGDECIINLPNGTVEQYGIIISSNAETKIKQRFKSSKEE